MDKGPFKLYVMQHLGGWIVRFPRKKFYVNVISVTRGWVPWVGVTFPGKKRYHLNDPKAR